MSTINRRDFGIAVAAAMLLPATAARAEATEVQIHNFVFEPTQLNLKVGTTVTWTNTDRDSHTSTSDTPGWNSGTISPGRQFSFTFQSAGTFPYHCSFHPGMVGTVVVR